MAKHVISVSLGSSSRDHSVDIDVFGEQVRVERRGTNGDVQAAIRLVGELDGHVDAFGLGGIDRYIYAGGRRYTLRDGERIARVAVNTPIVDGSGLKDSLERWVIPHLENEGHFTFAGKRVLMVAGVDRFGMAEALTEAGAEVLFGDLIFALGVPYPLRSLKALARLARCIAPIIGLLPARWIYPTGAKQHETQPKYRSYYDWADMIAGDYHFIKQYMPERLDGKVILTNTVTSNDITELKERGVATLITTTPDLGGRSFGTNVVEATLVAISGLKAADINSRVYMEILERIDFRPRVLQLNSVTQPETVGAHKRP